MNLEYLRAHGIKLARRVTGGGAVYHDLQNLNYSFAGPIGSFAGISREQNAPICTPDTSSPPSREQNTSFCTPDPSSHHSGEQDTSFCTPGPSLHPSGERDASFCTPGPSSHPSGEQDTPLCTPAPSSHPSGEQDAPICTPDTSVHPSGEQDAPICTPGLDVPSLFVRALRDLGLPASLTGRNDIFVDGRKVSGYARSLWKNRELVHGTLMYNVDIDTLTAVLNVEGSSKLALKGVASVRSRVANVRDYFPQFSSLDELQAALQEILSRSPEDSDSQSCEFFLTESQRAEIDSLAGAKFASQDWIYRF